MTPPATFVERGGRKTEWRSESSPAGLATKTHKRAGAAYRKWHMLRRCVRPQAHRRTGTLAGPARASHNAKPTSHLAMSRGHDGSPGVRRRGTAHATCLEWMPPLSWATAHEACILPYKEARLYGEHKGGDPRTIAKARP